jgi:hypothetical protein
MKPHFLSSVSARPVGRLLVPALVLLLTACGGGGGSNAASTSVQSSTGTGTVGMLLTDATTNDFDAIEMTITRIQLLAADGGHVEVFSSPSGQTVDLLQLTDLSQLISLATVPAGLYEKIRLTLSQLELIKKDDAGNVIERIDVPLPGNGKLDLNPRMTFAVEPGSTLLVQLDIDAKKSIHIVQTGNGGFQFRPVVFVKIITAGQLGKIVQLHGVIQDIKNENGQQELDLCQIHALTLLNASDKQTAPCIDVSVGTDSSIFNSNADPILFSDLQTGDEVTVFGTFTMNDIDDQAPDGAANENDIDLSAFVIERGSLGTFATLRGTVDSAPTGATDSFLFSIDPAQNGIPTGSQLQVALQSQTKIFSKDVVPLDFTAIQPGLSASVNGILLLSNNAPDMIKSTLVVLNLQSSQLTKLSGQIIDGSIDASSREFMIQTATATQECVDVPLTAHIVRVTSSSSGVTSESVGFDALMPAQDVDVFGTPQSGGCFVADTVVILVSQ